MVYGGGEAEGPGRREEESERRLDERVEEEEGWKLGGTGVGLG
jgi:hypothetical protein